MSSGEENVANVYGVNMVLIDNFIKSGQLVEVLALIYIKGEKVIQTGDRSRLQIAPPMKSQIPITNEPGAFYPLAVRGRKSGDIDQWRLGSAEGHRCC